MAKQDPKGNFGSPLTARLGAQFKSAAADIAKPPPVAPVLPEPEAPVANNIVELKPKVEEQQGSQPATPKALPRTDPQDTSTTSIRVILNLTEREGLDTLINNLTKKLGARVKLANLIRANIMLLMEAQEHILARAERNSDEFNKRPANNDALALAQFEDQLKQMLGAGLFDAARRGA